MSREAAARWKALAAVVFWGASFPSQKIAVAEISYYTLVWLRVGLGAATLLLYLVIRKRLRILPARQTLAFLGLGFLGIYFHNSIQAYALQTVPAGLSGLLIASSPIAIAVLGALILSERIGLGKISGILLAGAGVVVILTHGEVSMLFDRSYELGELIMVFSVVTWGLFSVLSRKALRETETDIGMTYALFSGFLFATLPFMLKAGASELTLISMKGAVNMAFLGVVCSGVCYLLWYDALQVLPASEVGVFLYVNPVVSVVIAALFLDEPVTLSMLLGGVMVFSGVWFVNRVS